VSRVTVLMPVFNGEKYLREAIESILNQTFQDFEFLIINDGSRDQSENIVNSYNNPRIHLVRNERNHGLIYTLNRGIKICRSCYTVMFRTSVVKSNGLYYSHEYPARRRL
jgi:glycosyltransferase involved in cell wall biosynthesis